MNFKLALAAAAVVGLAGTAQAADLAKKAPAAANYVKICDAYGAGYFYIPGSDTCLKIGGYVRAEVRTGNAGSYYADGLTGVMTVSGMNQSQRATHGVYTRARANINFDTRTSTEYGLLRTYVEFWLTNSSGQTGNTVETNLRQAFVQFGGLTAGRAQSFFDFVEGSYNIGNIEADSSDHRANLLGYTFAFGNGITASAAIQDQSTVDAPTSYAAYVAQAGNPTVPVGAGNATYGGVKYPDLVANVNITQAWGRAQVMGALHDDYTVSHGDKWGYAVGAGVEVNLPMLAPGDKAFVQGMYTSGAVGYALVNPIGTLSNAFGVAMFQTRDFWAQSATSIKQTTAWSISGGFNHNFSKTWEANLGASYAAVDQFSAQDYNQIIVGADLRWKPVSGFYIAAALDYYDLNFTSATKGAYNAAVTGGSSGLHDTSAWLGTIRVQRSF